MTETNRRSGGLLRNRNFRSLLGARTAVFFGNSIGVVGLSFGILQLPGGSGSELGVVLFVRSVALVGLLLAGGVFGDRYPKRRVMMIADLLAGVSQLGIGLEVIARHNDAALLLLFSAINGGATGLFMPASTGIIPEVVDRPLLQSANAVLRGTINLANIAGSGVAGVLIATVGPGISLLVNAFMYFGSVACLSMLRGAAAPTRSGSSFLADLVAGWRSFVAYTWVWVIVAQAAVINALSAGARQVLGPVVANGQPNGPTLWAFALGAQTVGLLAGSVVGLRFKVRYPLRTAVICISFSFLPIFVLAAPVPLIWILPAMFVCGFAIDLFTILWETALQSRVPAEALSRVSSYDALGSFALYPVGLLAAGALAGSTSVQPALYAGAIAVLVIGLAALLVPDVRNFRYADDPVPAASR